MCWVFYDQLKIVVMIVIISLKEQFNNSEYEMLNVLRVLSSTQNSPYDCYHQPQRAIQQLRI